MRFTLKRYSYIYKAVCLFVFIVLFVAAHFYPAIESDPDRFYHLAISRVYASQGFPDKVPQAEDVGWAEAFAEKEFLFHVLTGFAFKIAGDRGVINLSRILFALLVTSLAAVFARSVKRAWAIPVAAVVIVACCAQFAARMNMLRPHVFAIAVLTLSLSAWSLWQWRFAVVLSGIYVLSYHAFYVPVAVGIIFCFCAFLSGRDVLQPFLWLSISVSAGIVANPAFPGNILAGIQHLEIASSGVSGIPDYFFGAELHLLKSNEFFGTHGFMLFLPFFLLFIFLRGRPVNIREWFVQRNMRDDGVLAALIVSCLFSLAMFFSPRAFEIAVPAGIIATCSLFQRNSSGVIKSWLFLILFAIFHAPGSVRLIGVIREQNKITSSASESVRVALSAIPVGESKKVFNWSWWISPYIFYHRPDLRFIDLLDPTFLQRRSREMSRLRVAVFDGRETDPWFVVRKVFGSDYAIIPESFAGPWTRDPHFLPVKLPPPFDDNFRFLLFRVAEERIPRFVRTGRTGTAIIDKPLGSLPSDGMISSRIPVDADFGRKDPSQDLKAEDAGAPVFIDTFKEFALKYGQISPAGLDPLTQSLCTRFVADPSEIQRINSEAGGISFLGVGGGTWFAVWANGKPLFQSQNPDAPSLLDRIVDLGSVEALPLKTLEAVACAGLAANRAGLALSLWSRRDLAERCPIIDGAARGSDWLIPTLVSGECLGAPVYTGSSRRRHLPTP